MDAPSRKSRAPAWTAGSIAALLLLYVLSWGPVKAHYCVYNHHVFKNGSSSSIPSWMSILYAPMDILLDVPTLSDVPALSQISVDYVLWCHDTLHMR